jgi:hypothetical protein
MIVPHWERSPHRHGYWFGSVWIGYVGVPLRSASGPRPPTYLWFYEPPWASRWRAGVANSLKQAKREVGRAYREDDCPNKSEKSPS